MLHVLHINTNKPVEWNHLYQYYCFWVAVLELQFLFPNLNMQGICNNVSDVQNYLDTDSENPQNTLSTLL